MAVIKHIAVKNSNYSDATMYLVTKHDEFTGKPILDENGRHILRDEFILEGINCDPENFHYACTEVNRSFGKNQSRREVKAHHYILSFDPLDRGENGLTMERAQALGMEFAERNFPGHQAVVCTHPDGHNSAGNIHVHIVINSVRMLTVEREDFMNRPGDALAGNKHHVTKNFLCHLKQDTMDLCQRENFYQVDLLSPAKVRITEREYWAQRRGQAAHDQQNNDRPAISAVSGAEASTAKQSANHPDRIDAAAPATSSNFQTSKAFLREAITTVMADSASFEIFAAKLQEQYGIAVHESRGRISYQIPDRAKPIRGRQLGTNFEKEFILQYFEEKRTFRDAAQDVRTSAQAEHTAEQAVHTSAQARNTPEQNDHTSGQAGLTSMSTPVDIPVPRESIRLIVDLETCIKAQQNSRYAQKVKIGNVQEMAKTLAFLQENGIGTIEELSQLLSATKADFDEKRSALRETESELKSVNAQIHSLGQYLSTKKVYGEYLKSGNKRQFREDHRSELAVYEAARKELQGYFPPDPSDTSGRKPRSKFPTMKQMKERKAVLITCKNEQYEDYSFSRARLREIQTIETNVKAFFNETPKTSQRRKQQSI